MSTQAPSSIAGNTITVDSVFGYDATGARNLRPFKTIAAALAVATSGDVVFICPGTYNLAAGITIPNGVAVRGASLQVCTIQMLNVVANTTLVTMGNNTRLEDVALKLTSAGHFTLTGILFPGTTAADAKVRTATVTVDDSGAGAGTSNVTGILSDGTGVAATQQQAFRAVTVVVNSTDLGTKRAVLCSTANTIRARDCNFVVTRTGGAAGSYIAAETTNGGSVLGTQQCTFVGVDADVSQTAGQLIISPGSDLGASNANALPVSTSEIPPHFVFGDINQLPSGVTQFLRPGMAGATTAAVGVTLDDACVVQRITVRATVGPGGARTDTFTVSKNGVATAHTVSLVAAATSATNTTTSVTFAAGDVLGITFTSAAGTTSQEVVVQVETI